MNKYQKPSVEVIETEVFAEFLAGSPAEFGSSSESMETAEVVWW